jgi:hypothetical protein
VLLIDFLQFEVRIIFACDLVESYILFKSVSCSNPNIQLELRASPPHVLARIFLINVFDGINPFTWVEYTIYVQKYDCFHTSKFMFVGKGKSRGLAVRNMAGLSSFQKRELSAVLPSSFARNASPMPNNDNVSISSDEPNFLIVLPDTDFGETTGGIVKKKLLKSESLRGKFERKLGSVDVLSLSSSETVINLRR